MEYDNVTFTAYICAAVVAGLLTCTFIYQAFLGQKTYVFIPATALHTLNLGVIAFGIRYPQDIVDTQLVIECAHYMAWALGIYLVLKAHAFGQRLSTGLALVFVIMLAFFSLALAVSAKLILLDDSLHSWLPLVLAVASLVCVEQLFRYAASNDRRVKLVCLNLAALFLFDIYVFSHTLIFQELDAALWQARAVVSFAACLFLILGSVLLLQPSKRSASFQMSRPIAFYTTSLVGVGIFISLLSLGGYYVRIYSGHWGTIIYTLMLVAALLFIATIFISEQIRSRLTVLIDKHLFRHKYDYRTEWLRLINYLAQPTEARDANQRAFQAIASITKSPSGALFTLHQGYYEPVYQVGLGNDLALVSEPADSEFSRVLLEAEWVFFPDSGNHEALSQHNELLPSWAKHIPQLWLISPLIVGDELVGFICLTKPSKDTSLNWEDLDLLKTAGRQLASFLKRHKQAEQLAEGRQFDTYNKLVAFIIHDLNNIIAQQMLVVKNAERHKTNPDFINDAVNTINHSVERMHHLLKKLRREDKDDRVQLKLTDVLHQTLTESKIKSSQVSADIQLSEATIMADPVRLGMTITHFIKNAQEATHEHGRVHVTLHCTPQEAIIKIEDSGSGMNRDFIHNRLFKPFETTKSGKGMGIGAYLSREYISELGGSLQVSSEVNKGTAITVRLPLYKDGLPT